MEMKIRTTDKESLEVEKFLSASGSSFKRLEHEGVDASQVIEFIVTWGPPTISLLNEIIELTEKLGKKKRKKPSVTIDLTD